VLIEGSKLGLAPFLVPMQEIKKDCRKRRFKIAFVYSL